MRLAILPSAWDDLAEGYRFCESQSAGVGDYFRDALISDIDSLQATAGVPRKVNGHHRRLATRFPFAVYYSVDNETVTVRGVLDCRRDPTWIRKRLRQ